MHSVVDCYSAAQPHHALVCGAEGNNSFKNISFCKACFAHAQLTALHALSPLSSVTSISLFCSS